MRLAKLPPFIALLFATLVFSAQDPPIASFPSEADRLIATGKLWITVKYFHPYLAYRDIDWDKALVESLPKIRAAQKPAEYSAAVGLMLDALADSQTRVEPAGSGPDAASNSAPETAATGQRFWVHNGLAPSSGEDSGGYHSAFYIRPGSNAETVRVPMGDFNAIVRLSEPATAPNPPTPQVDRAYTDAYPSTELRILAAYKIWGIFHYFFAYRDLLDEDWDELLPVFLPRIIAAKDAKEYNLAIGEWLTNIADSHARIASETLTDYFGKAPVGLRLRLIEKQAAITEVLDPQAVGAGVKVGDIVKSVDGETLVDRFRREAHYVAASTTQSLGDLIIRRILNGAEGSSAVLSIEDSTGARKQVTLKRTADYLPALAKQRTSEVVKILPGNIGYADLDRLAPTDVDAMFDKFKDTEAIIFDMRGYPMGSAWAIAPRLTEERDVAAAIFTGPLTIGPDIQRNGITGQSSSYFLVQTLPNSNKWKYKGRTVMLIDERTISQAEHTGLFLEAANKTEFIGTPSAGANGDVTNFTVPGGITIYFSGHDVRHANGGKLQRLGLQPNVSIAPTLAGIRAHKDEVLERAVEYLSPKPAVKVQPKRASLR